VERKLNIPPTVLIHPASKGWKVSYPGGAPEPADTRFDTLKELAASLPVGSIVNIALPVSAVLIERMTMPATDRNELRGMVHLQLEKSLPFQVEDVTCNFQVLNQTGSESSLMALAINNAQFNSLCQPLRDKGLLPRKATFFPMHLLGVQGMPRRVYTYPVEMGWGGLNAIASLGALTIAISMLLFVVNVWRSLRHGAPAGGDPAAARRMTADGLERCRGRRRGPTSRRLGAACP